MKLWGGRFTKESSALTDDFNSSIHFDNVLYKYDIQGSIAHVKMLAKQGIISQEDSQIIQTGLEEILEDIENGKVEFDIAAEDIHMNIETLLIDKVGDVGKKLHTGRSRNDQVALDIKMYTKDKIKLLRQLLKDLMATLLQNADENIETIMPGYTHLQKAQPITLAHHLLAYFDMFKRDIERLEECYKRTDIMPLGAGALAGTTYNLDRDYVAQQLQFSEVTTNSIDSVSDRDYCIEFMGCMSMIMMHLSRFSEEIILWCSDEFNFAQLDDEYSTGSSIMPQKKNPDIAELVRGKTGRVYGNLMSLLTTMKGLPLAYNKDMQEDKEALFDSVNTLTSVMPVFANMLATLKFNKDVMYKSASKGFTNATDAADWLVNKGIPFREAHGIIGRLVLYAIDVGKDLDDLTIDEYKEISPVFDESIYESISLETCVENRKLKGGPSKQRVKEAILAGKQFLTKINKL